MNIISMGIAGRAQSVLLLLLAVATFIHDGDELFAARRADRHHIEGHYGVE